jgi:aryl-alcohol dehydrogenase-like predicted oxidoreductase
MKIGLGCGPLGAMEERDAVRLVHAALEMGVRVFDTAPSYGASESHLARALTHRASSSRRPGFAGSADAFVVTKGGYGVEGCADWTPECIARGIDRAVSKLGRVSAFLLHSCPPRDDLIEPLVRAREAGKVSFIGYSGDGDGLAWAARVDAFDVLECSINVVDQHGIAHCGRGKRVVAKRPLANGVFRDVRRPDREDRAIYWDRMHAMFEAPPSFDTMIRFAAWSGAECALVGTTSEAHLRDAISAAGRGPIDTSDLRARFDPTWTGLV